MKAIHLLPLGGPGPDLVDALPGPLRQAFRIRVETHAFGLDPEQFFDAGRGDRKSVV